MTTLKTEVKDVIYNAAEQTFEARVIVHNGEDTATYPCSISAPITMSFDRASEGLSTQALRRHGKPQSLRSYLTFILHTNRARPVRREPRRGLPIGQFGYFRGRAA